MKHGIFKKLLSLLLAMTLILSLGLTAAFADEEAPVIDSVAVKEENGTVTVTAKAPADPADQKVEVKADGNTVTVVAATGEKNPDPVTVTTEAPVTVEVKSDVSAGSNSTEGIIYGIQTDGQNVTVEVGTVTATVTNSEPASGDNTSAQAVYAQGSTVRADTVNAKGYDATAVRGYSGSEINVGTATATAVHTAAAVDANDSNTKIEVNTATATATATGDDSKSQATAIQVEKATVYAGSAEAKTENGTAYGISVKEGGGTVTADSVTATSNKGKAIAVEAKNSNTVVTVKNDVTATSTNGTANGIEADKGASVTAGSVTAATAEGNGSPATAVSAAGGASVTADSAYAKAYEATAVRITNSSGTATVQNEAKADGMVAKTIDVDAGGNGNSVNVTVGSAVAIGNSIATAVSAAGEKTVVTVNGEVKASSRGYKDDAAVSGIKAADGASVTAGSVEAASENGLAIAVSVVASDPEKPTSVIVREDVQSSNTGVQVDLVPDAKEAEAVVEIGGTLKVDEGGTPVLIGSGVTEDNIAITVWKVEIDGQQAKEGEIVKAKNGGAEATDEQKAAAKAVEESIQYIIQIKPEQQSNIRSSKATAKANETFTVTVTPPDGKKLDAVYTDEGEKIEATLNDDGTYSVTVRVGGGMLLSAKFSDKPVEPAPAPVPVPVPPAVDTGTAAANDWAAATVRLVPENGAYTVTLTTRVPTITFLRQTLEKFAKYNDRLVIDTPYGSCEISLAELLNFNEKAVNFRIVVTSTALEIYVNGELFRSIPLSDLT